LKKYVTISSDGKGRDGMNEQTKAEKRQAIIEKIQGMRLMDDNFMSAVLSDKACAELVIRIILNRDDITVKSTKTQYTISSLRSLSVRLDVYAEDTQGKRYDIEIQRSDKLVSSKQARYNSSLMDADALLPGEDYDKLPETYVIFITENDVLNENKPLYIIDRTINGTTQLFGDGSHIIYVNGENKDDTALGRLMSDFACVDPQKMKYKLLASSAGYYKHNKEGVQAMCRIVEEIVEKERAEERAERDREIALKMIAMGKLSYEEISTITGVSLDEIK